MFRAGSPWLLRTMPMKSSFRIGGSPFLCTLLLRHEIRVVAEVKKDPAVQFIALDHRPATPLSRFHLVVAVPRELHGRFAIPCDEAAIHLALDVAEVKGADAVLIELDESLVFFVE